MKNIVIATISVVLVTVAGQAFSQCYGSSSIYTCNDRQSGNSYNVQRYGNSTYMQGRNPRNGTTWNQQTNRWGNTSQTTGRASNGQYWNSTTTKIGNTTTTHGRDANGRYFSKTCNQFGCY